MMAMVQISEMPNMGLGKWLSHHFRKDAAMLADYFNVSGETFTS